MIGYSLCDKQVLLGSAALPVSLVLRAAWAALDLLEPVVQRERSDCPVLRDLPDHPEHLDSLDSQVCFAICVVICV